MATSKSPAVTAACGCATSAVATPKRSPFHALRSLRPSPAATLGKRQRGSQGPRTCPPAQPLQPRASRHPARAGGGRSAGPGLRAHVPSAGPEPTTTDLRMGSVKEGCHSVSPTVKKPRYATDQPLPSISVPCAPRRPQALPVHLAHAVPVPSRSHVWRRGGHSRVKRGSVVLRRPCIARRAEKVGPPQGLGLPPAVHAPCQSGCRASGRDGHSRAKAVCAGHRKVGSGPPRAAAA